jgi:hypothetical protein
VGQVKLSPCTLPPAGTLTRGTRARGVFGQEDSVRKLCWDMELYLWACDVARSGNLLIWRVEIALPDQRGARRAQLVEKSGGRFARIGTEIWC